MNSNAAALSLYQALGFQKVDEGHVYRLKPEAMG
jgi:ribosomal protein S18 acetylase RimI-like enzyme